MSWPSSGVHDAVPFADYRADDIRQTDDKHSVIGKAVSKSLIVDFMDDPGAWKASPPKKQTAAMKAGSLLDCLLTTPAEMDKRYSVQPHEYISAPKLVILTSVFGGEWRPNTKACQAWKSEQVAAGFEVMTPEKYAEASEPKPWNNNSDTCAKWKADEEAAGKEVVSMSSMLDARAQMVAIMSHPAARKLITGSRRQVAFRHKTKHGFDAKGLIDIVPPDDDTLADLKCCEPSALESKRSLQRYIFDWSLHIQAGGYCEGWTIASGQERVRFKFIFVSSKAPFRVAVVELPLAAILFGADQYRAGIAKFAKCMESGRWPSIWDEEVELDLPEYAYLEGGS